MGNRSVKRTILYSDDIELEQVQNLCDRIDDFNGKATLYFSSNGGYCYVGEALKDKLNQYKDELDIVLTYCVCSAAFDLILRCKNKVRLSRCFDHAMIHKTDTSLSILSLSKKNGLSRITQKRIKSIYDADAKFLCKFLNEDQLDRYNKGEDVYFSRSEFQQMLNKR